MSGWTYEGIAKRAVEDPAFEAGLRAAVAVCRAHGATDDKPFPPCPPDMLAVYIERLADGELP